MAYDNAMKKSTGVAEDSAGVKAGDSFKKGNRVKTESAPLVSGNGSNSGAGGGKKDKSMDKMGD